VSKKYLDIGIVSFMAYPGISKGSGPIIDSIKKIVADPFFSLIEITHIEDKIIREEVKKILVTSAIRVSFGAHPAIFGSKLDINSMDNDIRIKSVETLKILLDEAYQMNSESFVFVSGPKQIDKTSIDIEIDNIKESINSLCNYNYIKAKEYNRKPMDMIIETFDDKPFAKNRLIGPTDLAVSLARDIVGRYPDFGLLIDLSHLPIIGENLRESLQKAKKYIKHIHIGNCILKDKYHIAYGDEHPRLCISNGEVFITELVEFLKTLKDIGYFSFPGSTLSFEVKPLPDEDPDITIAGSKRILIKALNLLNL